MQSVETSVWRGRQKFWLKLVQPEPAGPILESSVPASAQI